MARQLKASVRFLARRWQVSKATIGRFLQRLESDGAIERERADRDTPATVGGTPPGTVTGVITICNYKRYQAPPGQAGRGAGRQRDTPRDEEKKGRRGKNLDGSDGKHLHPPSAAAPAKPTPTQREAWDDELKPIWDYLLANDFLGTDLDHPAWWRRQLDWIESTHMPVFPLDELKAYIAHQDSQTRSRRHRSRKRGFRNWLATALRWRERDADREAIRDRERDRGRP